MSGAEPPVPPGDPTRPTEPLRPPAPAQPRRPVSRQLPAHREPPDHPQGYPPEEPWKSNPWAAVVTGLLALLVGAVIGYLVGNGGQSTKTVASGPPVTHTVTSTVTGPTKVETVTQKTVTQAPADEQKRVEAEEKAQKLEKENEELRKGETP